MDQPHLFPLADLKTEGYAQPEPRNDEDDTVDADTEAEAA
jgi:hypothetical protein